MELLRWGAQRPGERVLRVWLGATFTYAGIDKLADPGFLKEGSTTYIGSQLEGFSQGSPIGPLLDLANKAPELTGVATALTEILIGVATLAGVAPAFAALVGALLSTSLWLSASWHVHPYFLGSDSIYAVAWLAYLLSLPTAVLVMHSIRTRSSPEVAVDDVRRTTLRGGAVVAGGLALAGVAALVGRSRSEDGASTASPSTPASTPTPDATATSTPSSSATGALLTTVPRLQAAGAVNFTDPVEGESVAVYLPNDEVVAFSRKCTHTGCTTSYDAGSKQIVCPCHGSRFDPSANGAPTQGPATRALNEVPVVVDGTDVRRA